MRISDLHQQRSGSKFQKHNLPSAVQYYEDQGLKLTGQGKDRKALCPFHDDSTPSFTINADTGHFHCFGCDANGGDVLDFHQQRYGLSFSEAAKELGAWDDNGIHAMRVPTPEELAAIEARKLQETEERARLKEAAQRKALQLWKSATPVKDHPYTTRKGVTPTDTLREISLEAAKAILGYAPKQNDEPLQGRLIVAPVKLGSIISTAELIDEAGRKTAIYGGAKSGGFWPAQIMPEGDGGSFLIGEGIATVLSGRQATGHNGLAALTVNNLKAVAEELRARSPQASIIILADAGKQADIDKAKEAAQAVNGVLVVPHFTEGEKAAGNKDINDLHMLHGLGAVKQQIESSSKPAEVQPPKPKQPAKPGWPADLNEAAFHGLAGDIVREIEPNTEADSAAILMQVLVAFGALVGRGPHFRVEGDEHHCQLFLNIVGGTGKGRKGTSWGRVREIFRCVDDWPKVVTGLSSGEGLKYAVRDPIYKTETKKGQTVDVQSDPGVTDKRLLVLESEFAQVLRQVQRQGNTLSATVRALWDSGDVSTLTKNDPITATGAHCCIVGHITDDELRADLTQTDSANGFANRFLFQCVKRSKLLPHAGKPIDPDRLAELVRRITNAKNTARRRGAMSWTPEAREVWAKVYPVLSEGYPGLFGSVTARAEAQCLRLALCYALLDESENIKLVHLHAALAVWQRASDSAKYIFGSALGDPVADEILRSLQAAGAAGLTRTAISKLLGRNQPAERIGAALDVLLTYNHVAVEKQAIDSGGGRAPEVWRAL